MNPARLPGGIQVERAQDHSGMFFGAALMKPEEVAAVAYSKFSLE